MTEISEQKKKIVFSGIQPTGPLTLGNYIGALKNWVAMQDEFDCLYAVADLHAVTASNDPPALRKNSSDIFVIMLALGLDPEKCALFIQSHVPHHAQLAWILNCYTQFGEASRMTQFKDKSKRAPDNINVGLFAYPVLQAADILLYQADYVPVGKDQNQHLELTRTIAERFNNRYSPTFTVPECINPKTGAKVYSLSDPTAKMGKSNEDKNGVIFLLDRPEDIASKIKRAVTDSDACVRFDPVSKPGVSNLITIYAALSDMPVKKAEKELSTSSYAVFKERVAEAVIESLLPIQTKFNEFSKDKDALRAIMQAGAEKAGRVAAKTLSKVYRKIGLFS